MSEMSKADVAVVEEPVRFMPRPSLSLEKQLQVSAPEEATVGDEENPEFKLPKMSSLVMVLMTNVLMQVISYFSQPNESPVNFLSNSDLIFHHRSVVERVRGTAGRRRDIFRTRDRHSDIYLSLGPRAAIEV